MRRFIKYSVIIVCVLCLLLLVGYIVVKATGKHSWERELAKWVELGGVSRMVDLAPVEPVADEDNAALIYQKAFDIIDEINIKDDPVLKDPYENIDELAGFIEKSNEVLVLIHEAAARPACVWPSANSGDPEILVESNTQQIFHFRTMARLVSAEAIFYSQQGNYAKVNRAIETGLNLSRHSFSCPLLINALVNISIDALMLDTFEEIYAEADYGDILEVQTVFDLLAVDKRELIVKPSLLGEGTYGIDMIFSTVNDVRTDTGESYNLSFLFKYDAAQFLKIMLLAIERFSVPYAEQDHSATLPEAPGWAIMTNMVLPSLDRWNVSIAQIEAKIALARQAILLRQYKYENGHYPEPGGGGEGGTDFEIMLDPFDGEPFDYELRGEGFILKSRAAHGNGTQVVWQWDM